MIHLAHMVNYFQCLASHNIRDVFKKLKRYPTFNRKNNTHKIIIRLCILRISLSSISDRRQESHLSPKIFTISHTQGNKSISRVTLNFRMLHRQKRRLTSLNGSISYQILTKIFEVGLQSKVKTFVISLEIENLLLSFFKSDNNKN